MKKSRFSRYNKMRGGFIPKRLPLPRGTAGGGVYNTIYPIAKPYLEKGAQFAVDWAFKQLESRVKGVNWRVLLNEKALKNPKTIGHILTNPINAAIRPNYQYITSKGTGIKRSSHIVPKKPIPDYVKTIGTKFVNVRANATEDYLKMRSANSKQNAVNQQIVFDGYRLALNQAYTSEVGMGGYNGPVPVQTDSVLGDIFLDNVHCETMITSSSNINQTLRIYECVAKISNRSEELSTPVAAFQKGVDAMIGTTATDTSYLSIGMFPSHSKYFRTAWLVEGVYDIELAAGGTHIHTSEYNYQTKIPNILFRGENANAYNNIAGITRVRMYVLSGTPVHKKATGQAEADLVTIGVGSIDIATTSTYTTYGLPFKSTALMIDVVQDEFYITDQSVMTDSDFAETKIDP